MQMEKKWKAYQKENQNSKMPSGPPKKPMSNLVWRLTKLRSFAKKKIILIEREKKKLRFSEGQINDIEKSGHKAQQLVSPLSDEVINETKPGWIEETERYLHEYQTDLKKKQSPVWKPSKNWFAKLGKTDKKHVRGKKLMKVGGPRQKKGVQNQGRERQMTATQKKKTDEKAKGQVLLKKKKNKGQNSGKERSIKEKSSPILQQSKGDVTVISCGGDQNQKRRDQSSIATSTWLLQKTERESQRGTSAITKKKKKTKRAERNQRQQKSKSKRKR